MNETKHFQHKIYYYTKKNNMKIKREKKETTKHKHTRRDETILFTHFLFARTHLRARRGGNQEQQ